jgi:hypothetical protein
MKKQILILTICLISYIGYSQNFQWAKSFGGSSNDDSYAMSLDASGNIYVTGFFAGTSDFDPSAGTYTLTSAGSFDSYIVKLDAAGSFVWAKSFGGIGVDDALSIKTDASGNVYVAGVFQSTVDFDPGAGTTTLTAVATDAFLTKFNSSGNFIWAKNMGTANIGNIALDGSGNIYTAGFFQNTTDFDPTAGTYTITSTGSDDAFITKLDASGNYIWTKTFGGVNADRANAIGIDASGSIYISGSYLTFSEFDPAVTTFTMSSAGGYDIYVLKLNSLGNFVWAKSFGGSGSDTGSALEFDLLGNVIVTGNYTGTADFDPTIGVSNLTSLGATDIFVLRLRSSGTVSWAKSMGGTAFDQGASITVDQSANIYTTGIFASTADFDPSAASYTVSSVAGSYDAFISKLDTSGNFGWAKAMGGTGADDRGFSLAVDGTGNLFTVGHFQLTADFDPSAATYTLTSNGNNDVFISKLTTPCPLPAGSISGTASVCQGTNASFSIAPVSGATGYNWSIPSGASIISGSNTNSISIVGGVNSGSIIVTPTNICGSGASSSIAITALAKPTVSISVSPSATVCAGNSITLSGSGASTYTWTNGNVNNISFIPAASAIYTVTGTGANGCSASATRSITLTPLPIVTANITSTMICIGNSITLNGGGATTYTWTNGINNGIAFTPTTTLTYTVIGKNTTTGCSNTATTQITVNNLPTVTASSSNSVICLGNAVTLNGSGATTYTWTNGVNNGVSFSPTISASYTVIGTDANNCSNTSAISIQVNSLPIINTSASNTLICSGQSISLGANGASTYNWLPGNSSGFLINVNPTANTTYTVTGIDNNGCQNSNTLLITVNTLPNVTATASNSVVCNGSSTILNAAGAQTYTWTNGVTDGIAFTPNATNSYTVIGTDLNGCQNTTIYNITVNQLPTITALTNNTLLCSGETATISATGANTYTWSTSENGTDIVVTPTTNTTYTVTGTDINGCNNISILTQSVSLCTGLKAISNITNSVISIYPNPNNGSFTINSSEEITLFIINNLGEIVLSIYLDGLNN